MLGGVQLGVLAAGVVLFLPMAMAGWHLSRNKMLFFSGALFITLAIGVHLTPYFPSVSNFVTTVSSVVVFDSRASCISQLHEIVWEVHQSAGFNPLNNNSINYEKSWDWGRSAPVVACDFQKLSSMDASDLLNGSWIVIAGDSQARLISLSLLNLTLSSNRMESIRADLFKRHSDFHVQIPETGMKLDFIWAPYATNLTDFITNLKKNHTSPDVLIMGTGLWHMLHTNDASDFRSSLESLKASVLASLVSPDMGSLRSPHLFWIGMPTLINSMLNTEEKRRRMTDAMRADYDAALRKSRLLRSSNGPLVLLDIENLSWNCGIRCTVDGMHYDEIVYDAAVHVMLNALLIESHQKL